MVPIPAKQDKSAISRLIEAHEASDKHDAGNDRMMLPMSILSGTPLMISPSIEEMMV